MGPRGPRGLLPRCYCCTVAITNVAAPFTFSLCCVLLVLKSMPLPRATITMDLLHLLVLKAGIPRCMAAVWTSMMIFTMIVMCLTLLLAQLSLICPACFMNFYTILIMIFTCASALLAGLAHPATPLFTLWGFLASVPISHAIFTIILWHAEPPPVKLLPQTSISYTLLIALTSGTLMIIFFILFTALKSFPTTLPSPLAV